MVRINFVGDIALFKEFQRKNIDPFQEIELPESDYNIGNFEFVIPNNREKNFFDVSDEYKVDYSYFSKLNLNRFNAFSLANNHVMDYGKEGISDVLMVLEESGIKSFGIGENDINPLRITLEGISFSIIGAVKNGRWIQDEGIAPDLYSPDNILQEIKKEKQSVDHVLVFAHIGTELVDVPAPEDVRNARSFIDGGASAVIGHHPHIIQGVEEYNNGIIAYSLGSFIYLPEFEVGYSKNQSMERDFSICLQLKFSKKSIEKIDINYYKLNPLTLLPSRCNFENEYFTNLNTWVNKPELYYKKIRKQLLKREIRSFFQRLKKNPFSTLKHYFSYLKLKHLKALFK